MIKGHFDVTDKNISNYIHLLFDMSKIRINRNPVLAKYSFRPGLSKRIAIAFSLGLAISLIINLI